MYHNVLEKYRRHKENETQKLDARQRVSQGGEIMQNVAKRTF